MNTFKHARAYVLYRDVFIIIIISSIAHISLKIQAQQTTSFGVIIKEDKQRSSLQYETAEKIWWKSNFKQTGFEFFL